MLHLAMRLARALLLLLIASTAALGQGAACDIHAIPLSIVGFAADPTGALTPGNFRVFLDGRPQKVDTVTFGTFPRSTYILLDSSGSMTRSRYWNLAEEFVMTAARLAPAGDVKVAVFNQRISRFLARNEVLALGKTAFDSLLSGGFKDGRTALYDAVLASVAAMPHVAPEDTVLVVTDGGDNESKSDYKQLRNRLRATHTRLIVVFVRHGEFDLEIAREVPNLAEVVETSGGMLFAGLPAAKLGTLNTGREAPPPGKKEQDEYLAELTAWYTSVQHGYRITLPSLSGKTKVKVELTPEVVRTRLFYPREIEPCSVSVVKP